MQKPIVYTAHAMTALAQRDLQEQWVERAVHNPEWTEPDPVDPSVVRCFIALAERGGRYLRVALVESPAEYRIVTVFLDRRARQK